MRYTFIRTNSAVDVIVPNSEVTDGRVMSWTHGNRYRRLTIPFRVATGRTKTWCGKPGSLQPAAWMPLSSMPRVYTGVTFQQAFKKRSIAS